MTTSTTPVRVTLDEAMAKERQKLDPNFPLVLRKEHCEQYIAFLKDKGIVLQLMFHAPFSNDVNDKYDRDLRTLFHNINISENYTTWVPNIDESSNINLTPLLQKQFEKYSSTPQQQGGVFSTTLGNEKEDIVKNAELLAIDFDVYLVYDALTLRWAFVDKITMMNAETQISSDTISTSDYIYDIITESFYKKHNVIWRFHIDDTSVTQETIRKLELAEDVVNKISSLQNKPKQQYYTAEFDENRKVVSITYFIAHQEDQFSGCRIFPLNR